MTARMGKDKKVDYERVARSVRVRNGDIQLVEFVSSIKENI